STARHGAAGPDGAGQAGADGPAPAKPAAAPGATFRVRRLEVPGVGAGAEGRRSRARGSAGRVTGARRPRGPVRQVHLTATLTAAAPYQVQRGRTGPGGLRLRREDLRETRREGREGNLILFLVDASGSMAARARMGAVKGAVLSLLLDAYQRRDKVGLITFRGSAARVLLPPTSSVEAAAARLAELPTGGRTPLAAGLLRAHEVLRTERLRDLDRRPLLVVVTDGRATSSGATASGSPTASARPGASPSLTPTGPGSPSPLSHSPDPVTAAHQAAGLLAAARVTSVVVDCESGTIRLGLAAGLARALDGALLRLDELAAGPLADSVRELSGLPQPARPASALLNGEVA
ncbi:MAG TPA: VWA domain-containing protein, partial [Streptosporangiaceae bacterium]